MRLARPTIILDRSFEREVLDGDNVPEALIARAYAELTTIHRVLGNTRTLIRALRRDPLPVHRVLDIGCGRGEILDAVTRTLGIEGFGVDLAPGGAASKRIVKADAVHDLLPAADVAYSVFVAHHLSDNDLVEMIRNVGRSCRRFILMDVVRSQVPLTLFRMFVAPFVSPITAADGKASIRRAYTPGEMRNVLVRALAGTDGRFRQVVSPLSLRQVVDITYVGGDLAAGRSDASQQVR